MTKLAIGMPVIINNVDRPCTRLVAVITNIDNDTGIVHAEYLCKETLMAQCSSQAYRVTPLSEFGVTLIIEKGEMKCDPVKKSTAMYPDGGHRKWQEEEYGKRHKVRPDVVSLLKKTIKT